MCIRDRTWSEVGKSIAHIHIKDGINRHDPEWHDFKYTRLGEGELPLYDLLDLLKNAGFDGYLSFEWEIAWRPELQELPPVSYTHLDVYKRQAY